MLCYSFIFIIFFNNYFIKLTRLKIKQIIKTKDAKNTLIKNLKNVYILFNKNNIIFNIK